MTEERRPAEVFPPGDFIKEELEERGWSQGDLASIMGRSERAISEILNAKRRITPEIAHDLAEAFGVEAEFFLNLEAAYGLFLARSQGRGSGNQVSRRARLRTLGPINEMVKRGWLSATRDLDTLERDVCRFYGISEISANPSIIANAARKSSALAAPTPSQNTWMHRVRQIARQFPVAVYSKACLEAAVLELKSLRSSTEAVTLIPDILSKAGIRFVIVEALQGTKIDGACLWLDEKSPVIAVSLRYDRIDHFWYTLFHELAHVLHGDGRSIFDELFTNTAENTRTSSAERLADQYASESVVDQTELALFAKQVAPYFSRNRIISFAKKVGVHPALVVGQLQHKRLIAYSQGRQFLEPVRQILTSVCITDGWGMVPSLTSATGG